MKRRNVMDLFEYAEKMTTDSFEGYGHEIRKDGFYIDGKKVRKKDVLFIVSTFFGFCEFKRILIDEIEVDYLGQMAKIQGDLYNYDVKRNDCYSPLVWSEYYGTTGWSEKSAVINSILKCKEMGWNDSIERRWLTEFHNEKEPWLIDGKKVEEGEELVKIDGLWENEFIRFERYKVEKLGDWKWTGIDSENHKWTFFTNDVDFQRNEIDCVNVAIETDRYHSKRANEYMEKWKRRNENELQWQII